MYAYMSCIPKGMSLIKRCTTQGLFPLKKSSSTVGGTWPPGVCVDSSSSRRAGFPPPLNAAEAGLRCIPSASVQQRADTDTSAGPWPSEENLHFRAVDPSWLRGSRQRGPRTNLRPGAEQQVLWCAQVHHTACLCLTSVTISVSSSSSLCLLTLFHLHFISFKCSWSPILADILALIIVFWGCYTGNFTCICSLYLVLGFFFDWHC